jgi:hypothetical protein
MALLNTYQKPNSVKTCRELSVSSSKWTGEKLSNCSEVYVVLDSYKENSLKKR